jgi:hypothetical protein
VNFPNLFQSKQVQALPRPRDEADWLACTAEEAQTFDDYVVRDLTLRAAAGFVLMLEWIVLEESS